MEESPLVVQVLTSVAREAPLEADPAPPTGWLYRMCRAAVRELPAWGVGVTVLSDNDDAFTAAASGAVCAEVEDLQFSLGEGPCRSALATGRPVQVPDLSTTGAGQWPGYSAAVQEYGVRAVFGFPLVVGAAHLGALDIYRQYTGGLSSHSQALALAFADLATQAVLGVGDATRTADGLFDDGPGDRYQVYGAQGMLMIQLGVDAEEALARLRAHSFAVGRPLSEVAQDLLDRVLVLDRDLP